jgi:hypothetical protein
MAEKIKISRGKTRIFQHKEKRAQSNTKIGKTGTTGLPQINTDKSGVYPVVSNSV